MKVFRQLTVSTLLGLSLTVGALQTAHADTAAAYNKVFVTAQQAAKEALAANLTGSEATCFIAERARKASIDAGLKAGTADYNAVVSRTTYQSAKANNIKDLLKNEVVLDCKPTAAAATAGRLPSAVVVGGTALAIIGVASAVGNNSTSSRPASP